MADAMLAPNLMNAVQPILRYRVDDCVILHHVPCGCGGAIDEPWDWKCLFDHSGCRTALRNQRKKCRPILRIFRNEEELL